MPTDDFCDGYHYWDYIWKQRETIKEPFQPTYYGEGGDSFFVGSDAIDRSALRYCQIEDWMWQEAGVSVAAANDPLLTVSNCFITPHLAWMTVEARRRLFAQVAENLSCWLAGNPINKVS